MTTTSERVIVQIVFKGLPIYSKQLGNCHVTGKVMIWTLSRASHLCISDFKTLEWAKMINVGDTKMGCPRESYITLPIFYSSYIIFVCCCLKKWKAFKKLFGVRLPSWCWNQLVHIIPQIKLAFNRMFRDKAIEQKRDQNWVELRVS